MPKRAIWAIPRPAMPPERSWPRKRSSRLPPDGVVDPVDQVGQLLVELAEAVSAALLAIFRKVEQGGGEELGFVQRLRRDRLTLPVPGVDDHDAPGARIDGHVVDVRVALQLLLDLRQRLRRPELRIETQPRPAGDAALDLPEGAYGLPGPLPSPTGRSAVSAPPSEGAPYVPVSDFLTASERMKMSFSRTI